MPPLTSSHIVHSPSVQRSDSKSAAGAMSKPPSRLLSKVNSFTREWEDDGSENKGDCGFTITGSSLPARATPAAAPVAESSAAASIDPKVLAKERRRRAIMLAMSQPADTPSSTATSSSTLNAVPAASFYPSQPPPTAQSSSSKRPMPWEESLANTKRAAVDRAGEKPASKGVALNIKQKVVLSSEQQKVLQHVVNDGKSLFFTGSAGTGKSVLLREIIVSLRKKYAATPDAVAVTASTGIAACNIGGITLHSFGGFGLGLDDPKALVGKMRRNKKAISRWLRTKVLIIDEVSMVDAELFDKLSKVGSLLRKQPNKPFGGMQVVVTGDFFQLPPVTKGGAQPKFAFEAEMWGETMSMSINLTKVFRQSDQTFVDMLNEMRFGRLTPASIQKFKSLSRPIYYDDGIEPTELFPMRNQVESANRIRMDSLNTEGWTYTSIDGGAVTDPLQRDKILSNFMASQSIHLKINAQVMLIKNLDESLVNGSMGKVIGFCHKAHWPIDGRDWTPEGSTDFGLGAAAEETDAKGKMKKLIVAPGTKPHPVVRFKVPNGHLTVLVEATDFKTELPTGEVQASRIQLPLIPAWAMSIHKSQGQTLDRVKVDLQKVFEKGQAYVALSRATSLDGLQLLNFRPETVKAHPKVAQWSATLKSLA